MFINLEEKYRPLVGLLKEKFPDIEITGATFDFGSCFAINFKKGQEEFSIRIEYSVLVDSEWMDSEDENGNISKVRCAPYKYERINPLENKTIEELCKELEEVVKSKFS